ncbi:MAG: lysylphosphatidylglycerol synthase domain-containing protein [Motiliproteus sp.]|nr:lysylphosphatidylglycerol synthase domain-containing protein [Motiliproteus sp.]MCW9053558.1 lysylphosphatidylglycerol synthase domain-containing protein [Motiliproteus sp.]
MSLLQQRLLPASFRKGGLWLRGRSLAITIAAGMSIYLVIVGWADFDSLATKIVELPEALIWSVLGLSFLSYFLRFARWHCFVESQGFSIPLVRNLEIYIAGFALTLTPGKAGEAVRSIYLLPYGVDLPREGLIKFR